MRISFFFFPKCFLFPVLIMASLILSVWPLIRRGWNKLLGWSMDKEIEEQKVETIDASSNLLTLFQLPEKSLILYEVQLDLNNKLNTSLLCTFSRAYIQDVDLYNKCLEGTEYSLMVPTDQTIKLFEEWIANKWNINQEDDRRSSSSASSTSSVEETDEQAIMKQMGLPGSFGETKVKKNKQKQLKNDLDNFFKLVSNLGFYSGLNYSAKETKQLGKTLKLGDINRLKYLYKAKRSTQTPRYRFVNMKRKHLECDEEETNTDTKEVCSSPTSSRSSVSHESIEVNAPAEVEVKAIDLNFDFGFDAERDAHLIATNFNQQFSNDDELKKYWFQRYRLFSKLNEGILMDREGWFSVTPERVAQHIARRMVAKKGNVILDAFTGVGGNAIQFARQGAFVYAIDLDPVKIRCARRNAEIYGVLNQIIFICGDFFKVAKSILGSRKRPKNSVPHPDESPYGIDAIFLSPPWGGPAYEASSFDIQNSMGGLDGIKIFRLAEQISSNIGYFLPRNTPSCQMIALADNFHRVEIEQSFLNGKNKTVNAYYGNLVKSHS